jgi:hypothetical protein
MNTFPDSAVCFVADFKYLRKNFSRVYSELKTKGQYEGDILIITNIFSPTFLIKEIRKNKGVQILRFKKIKFDKHTEHSLKNLNIQFNRHTNKNFQWHKLHLFNKRIKKWKYIFYFDINMSIHSDINLIINNRPKNKIFARADGYPDYNWKLSSQFDKSQKIYKTLSQNFDLERSDYFQTGLMYFDTSLISDSTYKDILSLVKQYPVSITNEQGILNLYFLFINKKYVELDTSIDGKLSYFYWKLKNEEVIVTKSLSTKNK